MSDLDLWIKFKNELREAGFHFTDEEVSQYLWECQFFEETGMTPFQAVMDSYKRLKKILNQKTPPKT